MKRTNNLYFRLLVPLGITLLVAMLAAWAIAVSLLTNTFDQRLNERLGRATEILADGEIPFSADLLKRVDRLVEARIALLDGSATVQLSTADGAVKELLADFETDIHSSNTDGLTFLTLEDGNAAWRVAIRPVTSSRDARFRYIVAAASLLESRDAASNAALLLGAAMLVATLLLALFGHYFARSITVPVTDLATMADRIADGDRDISSSFEANDEIGLLARALNRMAGRLRQYEQDLAQQSRLAGLGDLAARLAHEIRNPLTAIKMQLQLLEESLPDSESNRVQSLLNEIRRMEIIVESALTLAAPLEIQSRDMDLNELLMDLVTLFRPALEHRDIKLDARIPARVPIVADTDRLRQVLLNLINNAADELPGGGRIRLDTEIADSGESIDIHVDDSGPGFNEDAERRAKPFGLGVGLTICREIVEQHGGELIQSSSPELGGARFTIRLRLPEIG